MVHGREKSSKGSEGSFVFHLLWYGASVYYDHLRGPVTLTPIAERLEVLLSLPVFTTQVCRGWDSNTQPSACGTNALSHCATATVHHDYLPKQELNWLVEQRFQILSLFLNILPNIILFSTALKWLRMNFCLIPIQFEMPISKRISALSECIFFYYNFYQLVLFHFKLNQYIFLRCWDKGPINRTSAMAQSIRTFFLHAGGYS